MKKKFEGTRKPLITGRSYQQARIYARSRGYEQFDYISESGQLAGLREFKLTLEALPGSDDLVLAMATSQNLNVQHVSV